MPGDDNGRVSRARYDALVLDQLHRVEDQLRRLNDRVQDGELAQETRLTQLETVGKAEGASAGKKWGAGIGALVAGAVQLVQWVISNAS